MDIPTRAFVNDLLYKIMGSVICQIKKRAHGGKTLAEDLIERGGVDLSECFVGGSFCIAKRGALLWAKLNGGKERPKVMAVTDATGLVLSLQANPPLLMR